MTVVSAADLALVLSGGTNNLNPNLSLGGPPSGLRVTSGNLNNLFADVSPDEAQAGKVDYRCLYLFNDGDDYVYDIEVWINDEVVGGSPIEVGITAQDEVQRITLSGAVITGGSFHVIYGTYPSITSTFNNDLGIWATNLQNSLRSLVDANGHVVLQDLLITAQNVGTTVIFDLHYSGQSGSRNHPELLIENNTLTPSVNASLSIIQNGSPVNTIAPTLDVDTTTPGGVNFFVPTQTSPIIIPNLAPLDGFPMWFRRTTSPNAVAVASDGFTLRMRVKSLI